jgi:tetratricopeptide (TPR) repeat protein
LQSFLGLKDIHLVSLAPTAAPAAASPTPVVPASTSLKDVGLGLVSKVDNRTQAERLLKEGDELFRAQNFDSALERYKLAGSTTPDLAEALWRQGHALVATHQFDLATRAFKRAIALTEDLGRGGFRLSDLYGPAATTKAEHLESLAGWAAKDNSADRYFLVGIFLTYDNQAARAEKFFQKAFELAGTAGGHIAVFLEPATESSAPIVLEPVVKPAASPPIVPARLAIEV